jgi:hypothetical protein
MIRGTRSPLLVCLGLALMVLGSCGITEKVAAAKDRFIANLKEHSVQVRGESQPIAVWVWTKDGKKIPAAKQLPDGYYVIPDFKSLLVGVLTKEED